MKLRIVIDVDVSPTLAETLRRGEFTVSQDGSGQQIRMGTNSPPVPKRKTKIIFIDNPLTSIDSLSE